MTSSLLHSVPPCLHGTAEGLAHGDAVTVAGSELIRTHRFEERAEWGRRLGGRPRSPGQGVSRNSTWPWALVGQCPMKRVSRGIERQRGEF